MFTYECVDGNNPTNRMDRLVLKWLKNVETKKHSTILFEIKPFESFILSCPFFRRIVKKTS